MTCVHTTTSAPPPPGAASRVVALHAADALALSRARSPAVLLDARKRALYELERVQGALLQLRAEPQSRIIIVYDSGTRGVPLPLTPTTPALATLLSLRRRFERGFLLALLSGGLPAVAAADAAAVTRVDERALSTVASLLRRRGLHALACGVVTHFGAALEPPRAVLPWLYVGSARFASAPFLTEKRVSHVLRVCEEQRGARVHGVCALAIDMKDRVDFDVRAHFELVVAFLTHVKASHGVVLVHCVAGVSRSVACVLAFLVWMGYELPHAWALLSSKRKCAAPNDGFWTQLSAWQAEVTHMRQCERCAQRFKQRVAQLRRDVMRAGAS